VTQAQSTFGRMHPRAVSQRARLTLSWAAYLWRRIGAPVGCSVVLLAVAGVLALDAGTIAHDSAALMKALAARTSVQDRKSNGVDVPNAGASLNAFMRQLPGREDVPALVEKLFVLAQQSNLRLEKGEYRASVDSTAGVLRYAITLPVRGPAASVQAYVLQALNQTPSLSLQGIAFKREAGAGPFAGAGLSAGTGQGAPPPIPVLPVPADLLQRIGGLPHLDGPSQQGIDRGHGASGAYKLEPPLPASMLLLPEPLPAATNGTPIPSVAFNGGMVSAGELEARVGFVLLVRPQ